MCHLGADVAKAKIDIALYRDGAGPTTKVITNDRAGFATLRAWLGKLGLGDPAATPVHVCLEATGGYEIGLACYLSRAGYLVSVVNPAAIKAYGKAELRRNKTDKLDAALIARYCRDKQPRRWQEPMPEQLRLQLLTRRHDDLLEMRQAERNRRGSAREDDDLAQSHEQIIKALDAEIKRVRQLIKEATSGQGKLAQQAQLAATIPGVGLATAAKVIGNCPPIEGFSSAKQLASFCGLTPQNSTSGESVRGRAHISRMGSPELRKALYMPALVAMRRNPIIKDFCQRLRERGLSKMAVVAAAMRKLLHLIYGVVKHGQAFDPNYLARAA
jgi:transposase